MTSGFETTAMANSARLAGNSSLIAWAPTARNTPGLISCERMSWARASDPAQGGPPAVSPVAFSKAGPRVSLYSLSSDPAQATEAVPCATCAVAGLVVVAAAIDALDAPTATRAVIATRAVDLTSHAFEVRRRVIASR